MRKEFLIGHIVALINIAVFSLVAPYFLNQIHHHWIVPFFCSWLLFETILTSKLPLDWRNSVFTAVLVFATLTGILLFWRQFSMFECFRHCEGRLAVGLILLSLVFAIAGYSNVLRKRRFLLMLGLLFAGWFIVVAVIGLKNRDKRAHQRKNYYQATLRKYSDRFRPGMLRGDVETLLKKSNREFRHMCCMGEWKGAYDDLIKIGNETPSWVCRERSVNIGLAFVAQSTGTIPVEPLDSDTLSHVRIFMWNEVCL